MYYFKLRGTDCSCDTAKELRAACDGQSDCSGCDTLGCQTKVVKEPKKRKLKRRKPTYTIVKKKPSAVADLPLVDGPITWAVTNKFAKKLKRTDKAQLRSDLKTRQEATES